MHPTKLDLEKAVLRIFFKLRMPAGRALSLHMLVKEWAGASLRRRDLESSLKRLVALMYLRPERTPDGEMLFLTPAGHEYVEHLFEGAMHNLLLGLRLKLLSLARGPRTEITLPPPRRRIADRIAPSLI